MNPRQSTKKLGELLIQRRLITPAQLERALAQQRSTREFLGAILIRLGLIRPDALLETLSEQFGIPHEPLTIERVDWTLVKQFPTSAFSEGRCLPIRADAQTVTVAIADPLEAWGLSAMEAAAASRTVKPVLVLEEELRGVWHAYRERVLHDVAANLKRDDRDQIH